MEQNISVIIPLHKFEEYMKEDLDNALKSIKSQSEYVGKLIIVLPELIYDSVIEFVGDKPGVNVEFLKNEGKTDFCSQINLGVQSCGSEYFSILEFDDKYADIFFKNAHEYIVNYPEVSAFLPLIAQLNPTGQFISFMNDAAWSKGVNKEDGKLGMIHHDLLKGFPNFLTCGGVFKTEDFIEVGMFKTKIELTFMYEYLLRATYNDKKFMVLPKLGYVHRVGRKDSLFENYKLTLSEKDIMKWYDTAKKEYFFTTDRDIRVA
jgi:hypothetical protein